MTEISSKHLNSSTSAAEIDDEIDVGQIIAALRRYRRLIAKVAGTSLLLSAMYAFISKPVWKGEFQIVLEKEKSNVGRLAQLASQNPMLANLAGLAVVVARALLKQKLKY